MDLISRQAAIDTEGLDEQLRCEMCRNPMHTDRGCDGNCKYDEKLYERIMQILGERIKPLPSAQQYTDEEIQKMQDMEQAQLDKAFELGREDAQPEIMSDWKNDFKGYIEALDMPRDDYKGIIEYIDEVPSAQQEQKWIPCSERLPEDTVIVTAKTKTYKHKYVCEAVWIPRWSKKAEYDNWEDCSEYNEDEDEYYVLEGWYERVHNWDEYSFVGIEDDVIAWMPLPKPYGGEPG